jgi:PAS domain S-box-containing protein
MLAKINNIFGLEIKCLRCGALNNILEKMTEQVIITDKNGIILFINRATEIVTGFSVHEAVGKKPSQLWGGHMSKDFYIDMWKDISNNKKPTKLKISNINKNNEKYDIELLISPVLDTRGEIIFFIGIEIVV